MPGLAFDNMKKEGLGVWSFVAFVNGSMLNEYLVWDAIIDFKDFMSW